MRLRTAAAEGILGPLTGSRQALGAGRPQAGHTLLSSRKGSEVVSANHREGGREKFLKKLCMKRGGHPGKAAEIMGRERVFSNKVLSRKTHLHDRVTRPTREMGFTHVTDLENI